MVNGKSIGRWSCAGELALGRPHFRAGIVKIPEASRLFRRRDSAGFSLVELLLVVAVPALLTALLLAVLPGVRDRGRRSVCRGSLRQLALAIHLDGADNRDRLPNGRHPVRTAIYLPLVHTNVARALTSYAGSSNILDCPNVRPMLVGSNAWRWPYERVSRTGPHAWGRGMRRDTPGRLSRMREEVMWFVWMVPLNGVASGNCGGTAAPTRGRRTIPFVWRHGEASEDAKCAS